MIKRGSGLLVHISSLDSLFGIGDIGPAAFKFVNFLEKAKQRYWQILPLNPTNLISGNSPYSSASAFAANTLLISPRLMVEDGLLEEKELKAFDETSCDKVDYSAVFHAKTEIFAKAFERFKKNGKMRSLKLFAKRMLFGWMTLLILWFLNHFLNKSAGFNGRLKLEIVTSKPFRH
jgi:4-alpha-glucanotransferase